MCSEAGAELGDREADARKLFDGGESGGREDCVRKLVTRGSGDKDIITLAAAKQKAISGEIEACVRDLQEPVVPHRMCSETGAESGDDRDLVSGGESGVALHPRDREADAGLSASHYICSGIAMKLMVHDPPPAHCPGCRVSHQSKVCAA